MVRLNLMPWRERRRAELVRRFQVTLLASLMIALVGLVLLDQLARARLARQMASTALQQTQLKALEGEQAALDELRAERRDVQEQQVALARLRGSQAKVVNLFQGLESALPGGAQLTGLSLEQGRLRLSGLAASAAVVAQFMRDLEVMDVVTGLELVYLRHQALGDEFLLVAELPAGWS